VPRLCVYAHSGGPEPLAGFLHHGHRTAVCVHFSCGGEGDIWEWIFLAGRSLVASTEGAVRQARFGETQ
jgi:hypothetical protein